MLLQVHQNQTSLPWRAIRIRRNSNIAIIGGGMAGITLAIAPIKHNIISRAICEQGHALLKARNREQRNPWFVSHELAYRLLSTNGQYSILVTTHKGRICISGDAAHATSPHHGAGASFLSRPLRIPLVQLPGPPAILDKPPSPLPADGVEDGEHSLYITGTPYPFVGQERGKGRRVLYADFKRIEDELRKSYAEVMDYDMDRAVEDAKAKLRSRLKS